tara:strand:+ start:112 stop:402 length:291 start_codon:yes stop_codon:yes gene_type:complete
MGWYAFYVGKRVITRKDGRNVFHDIGDVGVGRCSLKPGIIDNPNGTLYVVSDSYMRQYYQNRILKKHRTRIVPNDIKRAIELFYKPITGGTDDREA